MATWVSLQNQPPGQGFRATQSRVNPQELLYLRAFDLNWQPPHHQHLHTPNVQSFTLSAQGLLERHKVNAFIDQYLISRPDRVFRAKGFLSVRG